MSFTINKMVDSAKEYEEGFNAILNRVQQAFPMFNVPLQFKVVECSMYKTSKRFELISEDIPAELLGIWRYAVLHMNLSISIWVNEKDGRILAEPKLEYGHRDGGSNGTRITPVGNTKITIIYYLENQAIDVEKSNAAVSVLNDIQRNLWTMSIPKEVMQSKEFIRHSLVDFPINKSLLPQEESMVYDALTYYSKNLLNWSDGAERFTLREINKIYNDTVRWLKDKTNY